MTLPVSDTCDRAWPDPADPGDWFYCRRPPGHCGDHLPYATAQDTAASQRAQVRNRVLDLIGPVSAKYADTNTARFAIGDFLDALDAHDLKIVTGADPAAH